MPSKERSKQYCLDQQTHSVNLKPLSRYRYDVKITSGLPPRALALPNVDVIREKIDGLDGKAKEIRKDRIMRKSKVSGYPSGK
ncbi:hypothetical protein EVAR_26940_1 [Eumeta japonica]|uniref:Uncharacterized protein n=1 Tax=Eumeta variegata TaxID=151549 RepID=A0A4C1VRU3_EUMVA|nr:hypothetical protein EVAR_26940_1 [Eumeta japonica]